MKSNCIQILFLCLLMVNSYAGHTQICANNTDSVYGLNSITGSGSGQIVSINVNNGGTVNIGSPAATSANANGLAFCSSSSLFYFFNQCGSGTTEFVSYNPLTGSKVPLAIPSAPTPIIPTAQKIRSGAMTADGFGYYTIYPGATTAQGFPVTNPAFYYYSVGSNTWKLLTQSFKDKTNHTIAEFKNLNSGDMTFDGSGNLWIVVSNAANYALYRIKGPLPVNAVASVLVDTVLASRPTPAGVSITGIAFNSAGKLYLSTGSYTTPPGVAGNNKLYLMTDPSLPLVTVGTLPNGYGDDLTSCAIPYYVLAESRFSFDAVVKGNTISVNWQNKDETDLKGYELEYSQDGTNWTVIKTIEQLNEVYSYTHTGYSIGVNFYRVAMIQFAGQRKYSLIQKVIIKEKDTIQLGPNPAGNTIRFYSGNLTATYSIGLFDNAGRLLHSWEKVSPGETLDLQWLKPGIYIARVTDRQKSTETRNLRILKQ